MLLGAPRPHASQPAACHPDKQYTGCCRQHSRTVATRTECSAATCPFTTSVPRRSYKTSQHVTTRVEIRAGQPMPLGSAAAAYDTAQQPHRHLAGSLSAYRGQPSIAHVAGNGASASGVLQPSGVGDSESQQQTALRLHQAAGPSLWDSDLATSDVSSWPDVDVTQRAEMTANAAPTESAVFRSQQHMQHRRRHRRAPSAHIAEHVQQQDLLAQHSQQHQPVVHPLKHVQLLQQAALVRSWTGALNVLEHRDHLQQAHVGLLWWQLKPRLQARGIKAGAAVGASGSSRSQDSIPPRSHLQGPSCDTGNSCHTTQQRVSQVLHQLIDVTARHADSMSSQSLAYTLQGIAAAVAAGEVRLAEPATADNPTSSSNGMSVPYIAEATVHRLWRRLQSVAESCSPQQLARCLDGGRQLGWQLGDSTNTCGLLSCWPVVEAACSGRLGQGLRPQKHHCRQQQRGSQQGWCWSSNEAGELLAALAGLLTSGQEQQERLQQPSLHSRMQQQSATQQQAELASVSGWHQQHPEVLAAVQQLVACACQNTAASSSAAHQTPLGQGTTHSYTSGSSRGASSSPTITVPASTLLQQGVAAMSLLQSCAALGVAFDPWQLENLVEQIEPIIGSLSVNQVLQVLQALLQLHVEPWESWLAAAYSKMESDMQQLEPQQLLQLLLLLPRVRSLQPSNEMLQKLAKLTAVYSNRFSWQQLCVLPAGFAALGYRPPHYWMTDYVAATSSCLQQQQMQLPEDLLPHHLGSTQHPQQGQLDQQQLLLKLQQQLQQFVDMLVAVSRVMQRPPAADWLAAADRHLVKQLTRLQDLAGADNIDVANSVAAAAEAAVAALSSMQYTPSQHLLTLTDSNSSTDQPQQEATSCTAAMHDGAQLDSVQPDRGKASSNGAQCLPNLCGRNMEGAGNFEGCELSDVTRSCDLVHDQVQQLHHFSSLADSRDARQHESTEDAWDLELSRGCDERLWVSALQDEADSMMALIDKGWQLQHVYSSRSSRRLAAWGISTQHEGSALATL